MSKLPESIEKLNECFREGGSARVADDTKNPYKSDTPEYESWLLGWEDMDDHLTARDGSWRNTFGRGIHE